MTKKEMLVARRRRAKLLQEFNKLGWTKTKLAIKHGISAARMWKLLDQAIKESV